MGPWQRRGGGWIPEVLGQASLVDEVAGAQKAETSVVFLHKMQRPLSEGRDGGEEEKEKAKKTWESSPRL